MRAAIAGVFLAGAALAAGPVQACTVDGRPSAFVDGVRAVITRGAPTVATYAWWAHFTFPRSARVGRIVRFNEDVALLRRVLPSDWLRHPWRWHYGDGAVASGDTSYHRYTHPGHYKVQVDADLPGYGWEAFDSITLAVTR